MTVHQLTKLVEESDLGDVVKKKCLHTINKHGVTPETKHMVKLALDDAAHDEEEYITVMKTCLKVVTDSVDQIEEKSVQMQHNLVTTMMNAEEHLVVLENLIQEQLQPSNAQSPTV